MTHLRRSAIGFPPRKLGKNAARFSPWKFVATSNTLGKHRLGPHPFPNQTSKPNTFKALKANANSLFSIANV